MTGHCIARQCFFMVVSLFCQCQCVYLLYRCALQGTVDGGSVYVLWGSVYLLQGSVGGGSAADRERVIFSCPDKLYTLTLTLTLRNTTL